MQKEAPGKLTRVVIQDFLVTTLLEIIKNHGSRYAAKDLEIKGYSSNNYNQKLESHMRRPCMHDNRRYSM